jgi:hypothetical protein
VIVSDVRSIEVGVDKAPAPMPIPAWADGLLMWDGILMRNGKPFPR